MIGLIGRKVGMTRVFTEDGVSIPCAKHDVTTHKTDINHTHNIHNT